MNSCQHRFVKGFACLLVTASLLSGERALAVDYLVNDEASCLAVGASFGGTTDWDNPATCYIEGGTLAADDTLTMSGSTTFRPQSNPFTNLGVINISVTAGTTAYYGSALFINRGSINIAAGAEATNYNSIENYGTFNSAIDFANYGSFTNFCGGTVTGNILNLPVVQESGCNPTAKPVPAMTAWSLGAMASILGMVGLRRYKKASRYPS